MTYRCSCYTWLIILQGQTELQNGTDMTADISVEKNEQAKHIFWGEPANFDKLRHFWKLHLFAKSPNSCHHLF